MKLRNNQSFLNRVSFRRRVPTPTTSPNNVNTNLTMKSVSMSAMRSCIDTLSETTSITPTASVILAHEGSSSGKVRFFCCRKYSKKKEGKSMCD